MSRNTIYFVVPVAVAQRLARTMIAADSEVSFGDPVLERTGVANRRAAFGIKSLEHIARIDAKRALEAVTVQVFYDELPGNWRYGLLRE